MLSPDEYRIGHNAMMRGDRSAAHDIFVHARSVGDPETVVLAYYAMAGPIIIGGTADQTGEDLDFILDFMVPHVFSRTEEMVPHTQTLQDKGLLTTWSDEALRPAAEKADIPARAPGGRLFIQGKQSLAESPPPAVRNITPPRNRVVSRAASPISVPQPANVPVVVESKKSSSSSGKAILVGVIAISGGLLLYKALKKK